MLKSRLFRGTPVHYADLYHVRVEVNASRCREGVTVSFLLLKSHVPSYDTTQSSYLFCFFGRGIKANAQERGKRVQLVSKHHYPQRSDESFVIYASAEWNLFLQLW